METRNDAEDGDAERHRGRSLRTEDAAWTEDIKDAARTERNKRHGVDGAH
jgi:hypothetical protein